jgi:hypothetical protein
LKFQYWIASRFRFDPHNLIIISADTGYGTAACSIDRGAFSANTGDDAVSAFTLIGPTYPITTFHFFLPPFLPIGFWGFLGPVYLGMTA